MQAKLNHDMLQCPVEDDATLDGLDDAAHEGPQGNSRSKWTKGLQSAGNSISAPTAFIYAAHMVVSWFNRTLIHKPPQKLAKKSV